MSLLQYPLEIRCISYYLYRIDARAAWYGLAASLRNTYLGYDWRPDIEALARLDDGAHLLIYNGRIDNRFIHSAIPMINGLLGPVYNNQYYSVDGGFSGNPLNRIYWPYNRDYIESHTITIAQQNNQTQLACEAQKFLL
jgi:hypothetical protein